MPKKPNLIQVRVVDKWWTSGGRVVDEWNGIPDSVDRLIVSFGNLEFAPNINGGTWFAEVHNRL